MHDPDGRIVSAPLTLAQWKLIHESMEFHVGALRKATVGDMTEEQRHDRLTRYERTDLVKRMVEIFMERHQHAHA